MITMNELVDLRVQQHIAHEIYRQQIMQRIPDPFPPMLPMPMSRHVIMPPRVTLPGVEVTLQNDELWKQFHQIGTEMIITKSGRRMFPSMRLSLAGLEEEANYCILLEMVPIGDCRYKFSGSQWVPAGGAEPQSPQRMYLHPDSPASGTHWQAQPILFNKVKLTNNTLDNNGHIVLASMHKYQPRLHVIRTADLTQIPWAPQQAFVFPETEFVAVTAYQNDRITKLKIDNNPFAKGFRESGQSRCKRKMSSSPSDEDQEHSQARAPQLPRSEMISPTRSSLTMTTADSAPSICADKAAAYEDSCQVKRLRASDSASSMSSLDDEEEVNVTGGTGGDDSTTSSHFSRGSETSSATASAHELHASQQRQQHPQQRAFNEPATSASPSGATSSFMHHFQQNMQTLLRPSLVDLACSYFGRPQPIYPQPHMYPQPLTAGGQFVIGGDSVAATLQLQELHSLPLVGPHPTADEDASNNNNSEPVNEGVDVSPESSTLLHAEPAKSPPRKKCFSISSILGGGS